ncbi:hypothetical protein ACT414_18795 (plasmid) [Acinetobacter baumannii]
MKYNKERIRVGDQVKVISTDDQLYAIGIWEGGLKGQIAKVTSVKYYRISVEFESGCVWYLRFEDVHKVVE